MEEKGVSPVVGTILLIAITVALAAVVATLISGLGRRGAPPSATLDVTAENAGANVNVIISHRGGDDLALEELRVKVVKDGAESENTDLGSETLSVAGTKSVLVKDVDAGADDKITVHIIHDPSKQLIYSGSVFVQ